MRRRNPHQWTKERKMDYFFIKAKKEGYKARSAYKLIEIFDKFALIKQNDYVLDLGAAPGAWIQVVSKFTNRIDAIDLLPINQISYVNFFNGNIFSIEADLFLADKKYDIILSDMAPNCTGNKKDDHILIIDLAMKVLDLAQIRLKKRGNLCVKIFDGSMLTEITNRMRQYFLKTVIFKPKSSFADNSEYYLIGLCKKDN